MSKSGSGGRTDWKDKIDQSGWVDSTPWAGADEEAEPGVEFLEVEPSAFRLDKPTEEVSESLLSSSTSRFMALGAVGILLVALAIMSRPGSEEAAFDQLPTADQQEILERRAQGEGLGQTNNDSLGTDPARDRDDLDETGDAADPTADRDVTGDSESAGTTTTVAPPPIPRLRSDLPETLTGTLHITGSDGSLVSLDWAADNIEELPLPEAEDGGRSEALVMRLSGQDLILGSEQALFQLTGDGLRATSTGNLDLLPTDRGLTVVTPTAGGGTEVFLVPPQSGQQPATTVTIRDIPGDVALIGRWNDRLLGSKAGKIWLLDERGSTGSAITDGQLLSFDGRYLSMLRCDGQLTCRMEVGPPDQPDRYVIPVPEQLEGRDPVGWASSATVSPDGQRLAVVDDVGAFTTPLAIDLETGTVTEGTDIVNGDSPLAWSPDGSVLAYAFGDDLVLWDRAADERYRIDIDREIDLLLWAADPPQDGE